MRTRLVLLGVALVSGLVLSGCTTQPAPLAAKAKGKLPAGHFEGDGHDHAKAHDHSSWWCEEHGVPEAECSLCSAKVAAEFKRKGDWCETHDRAKSQCFVCDPKLKEKFAAQYRAKFGKEPPVHDAEKDAPAPKP